MLNSVLYLNKQKNNCIVFVLSPVVVSYSNEEINDD